MSDSTRRALLKSAGVAGAASLAGCVGGLPVVGNGGRSQLTKYAEQIRESTKKYDENRELARQEGYEAVFGPLVPGQGWHFQHLGYTQEAAQNGEFDLEKPQILGYDTEGRLGYVEYGAPVGQVPQPPELFSDVDAEVEWAPHRAGTHILANEDDEVKPLPEWSIDELMTRGVWADLAPPDPNIERGDEVEVPFGASRTVDTRVADFVTTHPDLFGTHFWVHQENSEGMFAAVNPDFAQP